MALRVGGTWAYGVASIAYHSIVTLQACSRGPCIAKSILRVHSTGQTLVDGTLGVWVSFSFLQCSDPLDNVTVSNTPPSGDILQNTMSALSKNKF